MNRKAFSTTRLLFLAALTFSFFRFEQLQATHLAGADLNYNCLGNNQYEVLITLYRDCDGINAPSSQEFTFESASCVQSLAGEAFPVAGTGGEITLPCASQSTTCTGGNLPGLQKWVYAAIITLPDECSDWVIHFDRCCRNCGINTIDLSQSPNCTTAPDMYLEATHDNSNVVCNSSPQFTNDPVLFVCVGQPFVYNHGVVDPDGDSLSYSLIGPLTAQGTSVNFLPGFSATNPISSNPPVTINPLNGDITMNPTQQQVGVMAVLVEEYRDQQLIGSVIRDMQVWVQNCTNSLPEASGIDGSNTYTISVCPDETLCFDIFSTDTDQNQNVTMTWNQGIPNGTFDITPGVRPSAEFCWTPGFNDISLIPHSFTVTVRDDNCPTNGIQVFSYNIIVPSPFFEMEVNDVSCAGGADGSIIATPVFGNPVYTYEWSNGVTGSVNDGLSAGTYTVTASDTACSVVTSVDVLEPAEILFTGIVTDVACQGNCNGGVDIAIQGGSPPYTFNWSDGSQGQDLTGACPGTYTVEITDDSGCSVVGTFNVQGSNAFSVVGDVTDISCQGLADGAIDVTVVVSNGAGGNYGYEWSNGANTEDIDNLAPGTYTITVTDENGCQNTATFTVTQPARLLISGSTNPETCPGACDGVLLVSASGGTAPYNYEWNTGATGDVLENACAGAYSVTVTDANGCSIVGNSTVDSPDPIIISSSTPPELCPGDCSGELTVQAAGGEPPYTYTWSNGANGSTINNACSGIYTVTVEDANGCTAIGDVEIGVSAACCFAASDPAFSVISANLTINQDQVLTGKYYVAAGVIITVDNAALDVTNVDMVFDLCAGINFVNGAELRSTNSVYRTCEADASWRGLQFFPTSKAVVHESTFKNAQRALFFTGQGTNALSTSGRITNNLFVNNKIAIGSMDNKFNDPITGNTFMLDGDEVTYDNQGCDIILPYTEEHWGVMGFMTTFNNIFSQNDFINAAHRNNSRKYYGVSLLESSAMIAGNTFTNMYRSIDIGSSVNVGVENNAIEVAVTYANNEHQIRASESNFVWITGNSVKNFNESSTLSLNNSGIYAESLRNSSIHENYVEGNSIGIQAERVWFTDITDNTILNSKIVGIYLDDCDRVKVGCNDINMDLNLNIDVVGIYNYQSTNLNKRVSIKNNCVTETTNAVYLESAQPNSPMPVVRNNFLFNYSTIGLRAINFTGGIGTNISSFEFAGRNSFVSNNIAGGVVDVGTNSPITVAGNFGVSTIFGPVSVQGTALYKSSASCGNQVGTVSSQITGDEVCDDLFTTTNLLIVPNNLGYGIADDFDQNWSALDEVQRDLVIEALAKILAENETSTELDLLRNRLAQPQMTNADQLKWFDYFAALATRELISAEEHLLAIPNSSQFATDRKAIQKALVATLKTDQFERGVTEDWMPILTNLDEAGNALASVGRDLVHHSSGAHDYIFKTPNSLKGIDGDIETVSLEDQMLQLFPNPATDIVKVSYNVGTVDHAQLRVFSTSGKLMQAYDLDMDYTGFEFDVSELPAGVYVVSLLNGSDLIKHEKLIKH